MNKLQISIITATTLGIAAAAVAVYKKVRNVEEAVEATEEVVEATEEETNTAELDAAISEILKSAPKPENEKN